MKKEEKEKYFKQQSPQLKGLAYRLSKKYKMEYDEIQSKVYLKFCEIIDKYDKNRSQIYTFLKNQLQNINNELKSEINKKNNFHDVSIEILEYSNVEEYKNRFIKIIEFYESYRTELSERAKIILEYILDAPIGGVNRKPSKYSVQKYCCKLLGWKSKIFEKVWEEIRIWWNNNDFAYY